MKFFGTVFCLFIVLLACSTAPEKKKEKAPAQKKTEVKKAKPRKKAVTKSGFINNENLEQVLSDFAAKNPEEYVLIKTRMGNIKLKLYRDVKLHSANFLMLAKDGYFDGTVFYRVVPGLVIQGGDTDDHGKTAWKKKIGSYKLPPEFNAKYVHTKGALAMSRSYTNNPNKLSSSWDFYIVHGQTLTPGEMLQVPDRYKEAYRKWGGAPHLDNEHTVFGQVVAGMDVIDKIVSVDRDRGDWPIDDIVIKMEVLQK